MMTHSAKESRQQKEQDWGMLNKIRKRKGGRSKQYMRDTLCQL